MPLPTEGGERHGGGQPAECFPGPNIPLLSGGPGPRARRGDRRSLCGRRSGGNYKVADKQLGAPIALGQPGFCSQEKVLPWTGLQASLQVQPQLPLWGESSRAVGFHPAPPPDPSSQSPEDPSAKQDTPSAFFRPAVSVLLSPSIWLTLHEKERESSARQSLPC